ADGCHLGHDGVIEELVCHFHRLVNLTSDDIDFVSIQLLRRNVNTYAGRQMDGRGIENLEICEWSTQFHVADEDLRLRTANRRHLAGHRKGNGSDGLPLAQRWRRIR